MPIRKPIFLVLANKNVNPSAFAVPLLEKLKDKAEFLLGNTLEEFLAYPNVKEATALLWIPPGDAKILSKLFEAVPTIKWVHSWFAGIEPLHPFIKEKLLDRPDIPVSNAKGAFSRSLAEWSLCAALHFEKQIPRIQKNTQTKTWDKFIMGELHGKSMGFVGFGDIGKATARIAKHAFGMKILALKRTKGPDPEGLADIVYCSEDPAEKAKLFAESDYIVCSLPGTPLTFKYCDATAFGGMKSSGVFISIGRGTVVDEDALASTLKDGKIKGAALDVFHVEPLPEASPLWGLPNVLITAHNADWTEDYSECSLRILEQNLDAFIEGKPPVTPVDKSAGY
uniref:D-isomer specific 2-hydroxyacid dehydrogenase NAD-binding domain-containing protein n=1 Tax=Chromera velia CCMP2878 TaxID=1169474 RepID=A0A0G4GJ93_9ALVE|mmetsp:Transcript_28789/g.56410  ORF Transcript_28789/g.56410 Transcript_28789/m.56410 type:complete len:339 (-) Transcript_28789:1059-2075(-)|eukprot:Cvel_22134.t1-p1 / transcript=Cvel_22134.t1 / gene=Cvel_22134 / organism=Chromera_velia_CCMP2878 / gene_product=Glyoxylate reductase, putative / transcript_product=Glyoxylate reductase, putative / location=Cvel_scaffold2146:17687-19870(+) / protein_length=338 / sequence_SO=supercontig / SO=protein_coding / is_pseudo=false